MQKYSIAKSLTNIILNNSRMKSSEWFESWFNTSYYHQLYCNRDEAEASAFISRLIKFLKPKPDARFLDLACGSGRHAIYINKCGYQVTGIDLSEQSIQMAKLSETDNLHFIRGDMRKPISGTKFDYIFNLFTSIGYFEKEEDDQKVIQSASQMLNNGGVMVIDYLNKTKVIKDMVAEETIIRDNVCFELTRTFTDNKIIKRIQIEDGDKKFTFSEEVMAYSLSDFDKMFRKAEFEINNVFGNYHLNAFDEKTSDRLIMVAKKND